MKGSTRIWLMRHLLTTDNKQGYISGQRDIDIDININVDDEKEMVDFSGDVYSSPLKRCGNTIKKKVNVPQKKVICDERLLERNMGIFEGKKRSDLIYQYSEYFVNKKFNVFLQPPAGETFVEFYERVASFYINIIETRSKDILICSHNQTLKLLKCLIEKKEVSLDYWCGLNFSNGKIYEIFEGKEKY